MPQRVVDSCWQEVSHPHAEILDLPGRGSFELDNQAEDPRIKAFRKLLAERAKGILLQYKLPDYGESKSWVNDKLSNPMLRDRQNPSFSLMSWNIERGYNVDRQIAYLKDLGHTNPDILCLQEADWQCIRTKKRNIAKEIAQALGYKFVTQTTAFVEVDKENYEEHRLEFPDTARHRPRLGRGGGVMGQATLSRYPIVGVGGIKLTSEAYDYSDPRNFFARLEPIHGGRVAQKVKLKIGEREVVVYNAHLESLSGPTGRLQQFGQIKHDAENEENPAIICGDFNTCGHGFATRFSEESLYSPKYWFRRTAAGRDPLQKQRRLGETEAELFDRLGFASGERKSFTDPFSRKEPTLRVGPKMFPLFQGKLDWTLFEDGKFAITDKYIGPTGLSDHRPLTVQAQLI